MNKINEWIWMDGTKSEKPPGKLLSGNFRWYGDVAFTGMTYRYLTPLLPGGDTDSDDPHMIGKRLIDGRCNWMIKNPVHASGTVSVEFDFHKECIFTEADAFLRPGWGKTDIGYEKAEVSVSQDGINFCDICTVDAPAGQNLIRMPFGAGQKGRYLRLTITGTDITLFQVWIWGDAPQVEFSGIYGAQSMDISNSVAFQSVMGIPNTAFTDVEAFNWSNNLKKAGITQKAVFSALAPYESMTTAPILPKPEKVNQKAKIRICRNGSGVFCLALTNTDFNVPLKTDVILDNPTPLNAEIFAGACVPSRWYGMTVGPLINNESSAISLPLMHKYIANSPVICDFPHLHLPPAGSCILWVKICGSNTAAGEYNLTLKAGESQVELCVKVLPVTLGNPKHGMQLWSDSTVMQPLEPVGRVVNEVAYRMEIGANVYVQGFQPGSAGAYALEHDPAAIFGDTSLVGFIGANWQKPLSEISGELEELLKKSVKWAEDLGLSYDRWFLELPDEPNCGNLPGYLRIARAIKEYDPNIRVYTNPCCWVGFENGAISPDDEIAESIKENYRFIDISVPGLMLFDDRPETYKYLSAPREYNGQYLVAAQHMDADRPGLMSLGRASAWESIARGMNWWGFWAYHQPSFESWYNQLAPDVDTPLTINYQCVYAGINGPVPTRASEQVREGFEDFRIMELLKETDPMLHSALCREYLEGSRDFEGMRERMLNTLEGVGFTI